MGAADATVVCAPWIDASQLCCEGAGAVDNCDGSSTPLLYPWTDDDLVLSASNLLFKRTCLRYPGLCTRRIRPCVDCTCKRSPCCCGPYYTIDLASDYPIVAITSITIDGAVFDSANYRLDDDWRIVRLDGEQWPTCQNLGLTNYTGSGSDVIVEYVTGREAPIELQMAAAELACELKKACNGDESCKLPDHVRNVTRRGVEFELDDVTSLISEGLTGNQIIDHALAVYGKCAGSPSAFVDPLSRPKGVRTDGL